MGGAEAEGAGSEDAIAGTQRQAGKRRKGGAAAAAAAALGLSQLSDQTGAAAAAAGGAPAPTAAGAAAGVSQRSEQTAAAAAAAGSSESEGDEGEAAAQAQAGAIVAVPQPQQQRQAQAGSAAASAAAGGSGRGGELVVAGEEGAEDDNLSDIADSDVDMYLAEPEEVSEGGREPLEWKTSGLWLGWNVCRGLCGGLRWEACFLHLAGVMAPLRCFQLSPLTAHCTLPALTHAIHCPLLPAGPVQGRDLEHDEHGLA